MCETYEGTGAAAVRDESCEHCKSPSGACAQRVVQVERVGGQCKLHCFVCTCLWKDLAGAQCWLQCPSLGSVLVMRLWCEDKVHVSLMVVRP